MGVSSLRDRDSRVAVRCRNRFSAARPATASTRRMPPADAGLADHEEGAYLPRGGHVGASAHLHAEGVPVGHLHHAHRLAVPVAEEGQRPVVHRLGQGALTGAHRQVVPHLRVDQPLYPPELLPGQGANVAVVEAQAVGGHQGTGLPHVGPQHLAKACVEEVGGAVVAGRVQAPRRVHRGGHRVSQGQVALGDHAPCAR